MAGLDDAYWDQFVSDQYTARSHRRLKEEIERLQTELRFAHVMVCKAEGAILGDTAAKQILADTRRSIRAALGEKE